MDRQADFIKETRYLAEHARQSSKHALWRVQHLLSTLEEDRALNTDSAIVQLQQAEKELRRTLGAIQRIEKLGEVESTS